MAIVLDLPHYAKQPSYQPETREQFDRLLDLLTEYTRELEKYCIETPPPRQRFGLMNRSKREIFNTRIEVLEKLIRTVSGYHEDSFHKFTLALEADARLSEAEAVLKMAKQL